MNYPTIVDVKTADERTLRDWLKNLPAPQTDVERTVHRRIRQAVHDMSSPRRPGKFGDIFGDFFDEILGKTK